MKTIISGAVAFLFAVSAQAQTKPCDFSWAFYGDDLILRDKIATDLHSEVTREFCEKFAKNVELVVQAKISESGGNPTGYSSVSMRYKGTTTQQQVVYTYTETSSFLLGGSKNRAWDNAVKATLLATAVLMENLNSIVIIR